jgi:hypothetical protein
LYKGLKPEVDYDNSLIQIGKGSTKSEAERKELNCSSKYSLVPLDVWQKQPLQWKESKRERR